VRDERYAEIALIYQGFEFMMKSGFFHP